LIAERIQPDSIELTGNTSVDAVRAIIARREEFPELRELFSGRKMVLMTLDPAHQSNQDTHQILLCIRELAVHHPEICVVWTMPRHAAIHRQAADLLSHLENIVMIPQMPFPKIVYLTHHCQFVITDSGSMQEYAAALGKPVVLLRERTERPEGIETGGTILTGSAPEKLQLVLETLADLESPAWRRMSDAPNPFGDGNAAVRIANRVWREVTRTEKRLYRTSRV
jgi:UDP-N-acetylglucosamine 2-epimerase (non-hydrolysing)